MEKRIIHLDMADFAVAVERVVDRRLRTRPVIISPDAGARSLVYDMSDEAYRDGVRKGMALGRAKRLSRTAAIIPPKQDLYMRAMKVFAKHALPFSPLVEHGEWDGHVFLDVTGSGRLFGPPQDIAQKIRRSVGRDFSLDPVWGIASNKLVSKVATRLVKPRGECLVPAGEEASFILPVTLPVLPGLFNGEIARLNELNIRTAGEARSLSASHLEVLIGGRSRRVHEIVRGMDDSPVRPAWDGGDVAEAERTFPRDTNDAGEVEAALYLCVEKIGGELRGRGISAREGEISIGYCDGLRAARRVPMGAGVSSNADLYERGLKALGVAWSRRVRLRHIKFKVWRLAKTALQLELFAEHGKMEKRNGALESAVDSIRKRFGPRSAGIGS